MRILILFLILLSELGKTQTYDWLRSNVNQFWFNQFVGNCKDNYNSTIGEPGPGLAGETCPRATISANMNQSLSSKVMTNIYFDQALIEQSKQNQCQFDYWSALNTRDQSAYSEQDKANKKIESQFPGLKGRIKSHQFKDRNSVFPTHADASPLENDATTAQKKIVDSLVESAVKIAEKQRELKFFLAQNPLFPVDPKLNPKTTVDRLNNEIAVLENSFVFAEDSEVAGFVKYNIVGKINEDYHLGKAPDKDKLKDFFYKDKSFNFQAQVVDRKLKKISSEQKSYSEIDGNYNDAYRFKVATVQSSVGSKILNEKANQNPSFAKVQCDLDAKYGKGEEIASIANSVVVGGVTIFFGGATLMLGKLAQLGLATQRAVRIGQIISSVVNTSISAGEAVKSIIESCAEPKFQKKDSSICSRVDSLKTDGLSLEITAELDHSSCLTDIGLAALTGAAAFRSAVTANRLKRDHQLISMGIRDRYSKLVGQIKIDSRMLPADRTRLLSELERSVSLSSVNGFPRKEFIESLAKENPQDLMEALKQINGNVSGKSWAEKLKLWISSKGLSKEDAKDLESCMVDGASKTSSCPFFKYKTDS